MGAKRLNRWGLAALAAACIALAGSAWAANGEDGEKKPPPPADVQSQDPPRDPMLLLEHLEKRRLELDEREKWLEMRQVELARLEAKLKKRIEALENLRKVIEDGLNKEKELDDANIARLAKIYSGMKAKVAAARLRSLDRPTAIKILKVMREKTTAKILGKMPSMDAVKLSDALGVPVAERRRGR